MNAEELTVSILDESTTDQQVELYKTCFEIVEDSHKIRSFWIKKHHQNPLGKSLIFGIVIDGKLAGMNAFLPVKYEYNSEEILCLQSCESGVNPLFQGRGIWKKIMLFATDYIFSNTDYKMIIGFPNYRNSYPGFVKMKWETKHQMNNFVLINNTKSFVHSIGVPRYVSFLHPIFSIQKIGYKTKGLFGSNRFVFKEGECDSLIWHENPNAINICHGKDWLKWKFDYTDEQSVNIYNKGALVASCVYKESEFDQHSVIRLDRICFNIANEKEQRIIVSKLLGYLSDKYPDAAFFRIWTMNGQGIEKIIKSLLFLKSSHPNPFIVKYGNNDSPDAEWNLSFFDLD